MTLRARVVWLFVLSVALVVAAGLMDGASDSRLFALLRAGNAASILRSRVREAHRHAHRLGRGDALAAESLAIDLHVAGIAAAALHDDRDSVGSFHIPEHIRVARIRPLLDAWGRFAAAIPGPVTRGPDTASVERPYIGAVSLADTVGALLANAAQREASTNQELMWWLLGAALVASAALVLAVWVGIVRPSDRTLHAIERRSGQEGSGEPLDLADAPPELARLIAAFNRVLGNLARSRDELRATIAAVDTLYAALRASKGVLDIGSLAEIVAELARDAGDAEYAVVTLREPTGHRISLFAVAGFPRNLAPPGALPQGHGLLAPLRQGETVRSDDVARDPRRVGVPPWHPPLAALLGVPVEAQGHSRGEIYIANRRSGGAFSSDEEACLRALAKFVGYAVEQAETHEVMAADAKVQSAVVLAAGMAHEINNAATGMRLTLEEIGAVAREDPPDGAAQITQLSAECVALLNRVTSVTHRVREAVGTGRAGVRERVNVAALARDAASHAEAQVPAAAPIGLAAPEEVWLEGQNRAQLAFVLDSLCRWLARRIAAGLARGGGIHVRVAEPAGQAVLVEIGHATMAPPADLASIFESAVRPTAAEGGRMELDLDLLLVRAVVQAAGARIAAVPGPDGTGLTFHVEFPGASSRA